MSGEDLILDEAMGTPPPIVTRLAPTPEDYFEIAVEVHLACRIADTFGLDWHAVAACLDRLSPEYVPLIASPEGWAAIGHAVACELGEPPAAAMILTVH